jgi:hypothetical protein
MFPTQLKRHHLFSQNNKFFFVIQIVSAALLFGVSIYNIHYLYLFCSLLFFFSLIGVIARFPESAAYLSYILIPFFFIPLYFEQLWLGRVFLMLSVSIIFGRFIFKNDKDALKIGPILKFLIIASSWLIIVAITSEDFYDAKRVLFSYFTNTIAFALVMQWTIKDICILEKWLKFVLAIGILSALLAVFQSIFGDRLLITEILPLFGKISDIEQYKEAYSIGNRISCSGLFLYRAKNVAFMVLPWCVIVYNISKFQSLNLIERSKWLIIYFLLIGAFLASGARAGAILPAICIILIFFSCPDKSYKKTLFWFFFYTIVIGLLFVNTPFFNLLSYRLNSLNIDSSIGFLELGMKERTAIFIPTISLILKNPIFGVGLSNINFFLFGSVSEAHNIFLDVGLHLGIPAMILSILLILYITRQYYRIIQIAIEKKLDRIYNVSIILFSAFIAITVQGIIGFGFLSLKEGFPPYVALIIMPDILQRLISKEIKD